MTNYFSLQQPAIEQFLLFGDSITEFSSSQERGFGFAPALQQGIPIAMPHCLYCFGISHHRVPILGSVFFFLELTAT